MAVAAVADPVVVVAYDSAWPVRFRKEARRVAIALRGVGSAIEHIGSTSVPGLAAKPVIDLLVGVPSLETLGDREPRLVVAGYEYVPAYETKVPDRRFFRRCLRGLRTHHLHVVALGGTGWVRYLAFRDRLRADPEVAASYAELKRELAARFADDRDAYTDGKTRFVETVLALPARTKSAASASPAA